MFTALLFLLATALLALGASAPDATSIDVGPAQVNARYVRTVFTSTSESNLYVYTSSDATNWSLLAGPTYTPPTGLIRDPSVMYHTDGKYYIAYTTNWNGTNFAIASSTDLKSWSLHATITTVSSLITPVNTWAPELKDPRTGTVNIAVSLSTGSYGPFKLYAFTATDSLLRNFSGLTGLYSFIQTGNFAGWGHAEGPSITQLPDGTFRVRSLFATSRLNMGSRTMRRFADGFDSGKYIYVVSKDLYNWSAYKTLSGGLSGFVRHGTVLKQW